MTKALNSIYSHLSPTFWTTRKCHSCQIQFTPSDYQTQNYQLTFLAVLKVLNNHLEAVVQLSHKSCCSDCTNYLKNIYPKTPKKLCSTLILKK